MLKYLSKKDLLYSILLIVIMEQIESDNQLSSKEQSELEKYKKNLHSNYLKLYLLLIS